MFISELLENLQPKMTCFLVCFDDEKKMIKIKLMAPQIKIKRGPLAF